MSKNGPRRDTVLKAYDDFAGVVSAWMARQHPDSRDLAGAGAMLYAGHAVMRRLMLEHEDCDAATLAEARKHAAAALLEILEAAGVLPAIVGDIRVAVEAAS